MDLTSEDSAVTPEDAATDVFFSQGTVYPHDAFDAWGFVGCMGSVAFRATPRTSALLKAAMEDCKEGACDDQVAMNGALLRKYGIQWNRNTGLGEGALAKPVAARLKVTDPNAVGIKVRMWPKPFAFRSFMKDVKKVETASLGAEGGAGGVCLGQVEPASLGLSSRRAPTTTVCPSIATDRPKRSPEALSLARTLHCWLQLDTLR